MSEAGRRKTSWLTWVVVLLLVVIGILILLSVGSRGPDGSRREATVAQLKTLHMLMHAFINEGNPKPGVSATWNYDARAPAAYVETSPASDPVEWVGALRSDPWIAKKLASYKMSSDKDVPKRSGYTKVNEVILDFYGTPIRFVPPDPKRGKQWYFMSAGPDGKFSMMVPARGTAMRADEIFSTDPG